MTSQKKIVTVLGATGAQGGSVVDALLQAGDFLVRGVTRDVKSEKAEALSKKGVEVVFGNILEPETIKKAFKGSYGLFAVTNYWDKDQMGKEFEIGKTLVDIAREMKITHFIFSSLPNSLEDSKGKYNVPHWNGKAKTEEYIESLGKNVFPYYTYVHLPGYYQNWGSFMTFRKVFFEDSKEGEKKLKELSLDVHALESTTVYQQFDVCELGNIVLTALRNPSGWGHGDAIVAIGDYSTMGEIIEAFSQHLGIKCVLNTITKEEFLKNAPGMEDAYFSLAHIKEFCFFTKPKYDIYSGQKANGKPLKTFADWLKDTNWKLN